MRVDQGPDVRSADPMLSIIELLRSRAVAGVVVDSLGLQLVSLTPEFSVEDLDQTCLDHIARFKRPRDYRFVDALPTNNYGKVLKRELRDLLRTEANSTGSS